jgi:anti-sigma-K factor RskA
MAEAIPRDEMDLLAAEHVLGLLDAEARRAAAALVEGNGTMRLLAEEWEDRLADLNAEFVSVDAPDVWPALDRQLFAARRKRTRLFWLLVGAFAVALVAKVAFWAQLLG